MPAVHCSRGVVGCHAARLGVYQHAVSVVQCTVQCSLAGLQHVRLTGSSARQPGVYMGCDGYEFGSFCIVTNVTRGLSVVSEEFESSVHVTAWDLEANVCVFNCDTGLEPYGEQFPIGEYKTSRQGGWRNRNYLLTQGLLYGDREFGLMCERQSSENIANKCVARAVGDHTRLYLTCLLCCVPS